MSPMEFDFSGRHAGATLVISGTPPDQREIVPAKKHNSSSAKKTPPGHRSKKESGKGPIKEDKPPITGKVSRCIDCGVMIGQSEPVKANHPGRDLLTRWDT